MDPKYPPTETAPRRGRGGGFQMSCSFVGGYLGSIFDIIFGILFGVILGIILAALSGVIFGTFLATLRGGLLIRGGGYNI